MNKKLSAITIAILMLIGMIPALSTIPPVQAQECEAYPMCVFLHPGIADLSKPGFSHTLGTLWGVQDGEMQSRQVFQKYLEYAVLASSSEDNPSSIGDLQFDFTVLDEIAGVEIYVPPEFKFTAPTIEESVWTDMTNDYAFLNVWAPTSAYDPVAPGWTRIWIGSEEWWGGGPGTGFNIGGLIEPGTYHVRLFSLAAPAVAGLYHFKIYYWAPSAISRSRNDPLLWENFHSLGAQNFPIIIVKSELNPAWVEATIRTELYFAAPYVSGKVVAEGTTPEGRTVKAQAYWGPMEFVGNVWTPDLYGNGGAQYRTYLFGLAEGTYDLTPYASGAIAAEKPRITVLAGQSYHQYLHVFDSPDLFVTVYSKHGTGETPWNNLWQWPFGTNNPYADPCDDDSWGCPRRDILLELYDSSNNMVGFWGSDDNILRQDVTSMSYRKWFGWANRFGWDSTAVGQTPRNVIFAPSTGLDPLATSASFHLVDNYDLLLNARGVPGTEWDGHVPWDTADYVSGLLGGAYTVEAFVTGYIMDQPDAYQRSVIVTGIDKNLQFDLRRSNWIEVTMHLPSNVVIAKNGPTTMVLTAEDANKGERAAAAQYIVNPPDAINGYLGPVVLEGKNGIFPNIGSAGGRGSGGAREPTEKDYGLNPTASTHSGGAVSLAGNPYTVKLYMADMGTPWLGLEGEGWYNIVGGDPQVSVFLCNSPQMVSFSIRPAFLDIFIRSVDFEVPAHPRPWTFPGSEVWVEFKDEAGNTVDILDPTIWGTIQDAGATEPIGPYDITGVTGGYNAGGTFVGYGVSPYDYDNVHEPGKHSALRIRYTGTDINTYACTPGPCAGPNSYAIYRALYAGGVRPTRLPAGQYTMDVHTHGYVMRRSFPVQVPAEGGADIQVDVIQGAQIRVVMSFKHEAVKTLFTGFVRVEVLNENDELVGASVYGRAEPNTFTDNLDGGGYFALHDPYWLFYDSLYQDNMKVADPAEGAGFGETSAYFPSTDPNRPLTAGPNGQRAMWSSIFYNVPDCPDEYNPACQVWASWDMTTPIDANKFVGGNIDLGTGFSGGHGTDTVIVDVFGFYWYHGDPARTWAGGWPTTNGISNSGPQVGAQGFAWDSGLRGSDDIPNWSGSGGGKYHIKVYAFDYDAQRMYAMGWPLTDITVPWGGADDQYITMNSLATLKGTVAWLDMFGNYNGLPWAQITASPGPDDGTAAYGLPEYLMWLPAGSHDVSASTSEASGVWGGPAEQNGQYTVVVSDGWVGGGESRLDHTEGVPVPELPALLVPFGLLAALAASVWLLRKRNFNTPLLMK